MQTCYRHPSRETGVSCSNCDRPICPDCMTPTSVGMRCPECAKQRTKVKTIRSVEGTERVATALIAINILVFLASGAPLFGDSAGNEIYRQGGLYGFAVNHGHDYWRLISSGFLHVNLLHIGFNMYILWFLGQMLEPAIGSRRFVTIYFVALLAGSCGALILSPNSFTVGASGAVFGIMGAAFIELRNRGIDPFQTQIGPLIVFNLAISFVFSGISIGGHIGGLIGGALAMLAFHQGDRRNSAVVGYGLCVVLGLAAVAGSLAAASQSCC
jgi:membrane associated rhomboid family serine protease